jgi:heme oxygenase
MEKQANNPVLSPTFNPALLSRTSKLSADISYFLGLQDDDQSWKTMDIHKKLVASAPLQEYVSRLGSLESQPSRLLAHAYVRYMGDLSGGQIIKYKLQKAYALEHEKRGLTFYDFEYNGQVASVGELKKIKDWFRVGMDSGIGEDRLRKGMAPISPHSPALTDGFRRRIVGR